MKKLTLQDKTYIIGNLDTFQQLHVARKVAPVMNMMGISLMGIVKQGKEKLLDPDSQLEVMASAMDVVAKMTQEDVDYVVSICLSVVKRIDDPQLGPQPVANGKMMNFDDIKLPSLVQICVNVLQENLADFFPLLNVASASPIDSVQAPGRTAMST